MVQKALAGGHEPGEVLNGALIAGMTDLGELFKKEEVYLPEVLFAVRAMKAGLEVIEPLLLGSGASPAGRVYWPR